MEKFGSIEDRLQKETNWQVRGQGMLFVHLVSVSSV